MGDHTNPQSHTNKVDHVQFHIVKSELPAETNGEANQKIETNDEDHGSQRNERILQNGEGSNKRPRVAYTFGLPCVCSTFRICSKTTRTVFRALTVVGESFFFRNGTYRKGELWLPTQLTKSCCNLDSSIFDTCLMIALNCVFVAYLLGEETTLLSVVAEQ